MEKTLKHNEVKNRFELIADGREGGYLTYKVYGGCLDIQHTVVDPALGGNGLGEILLDAAVRYAEEKGLKIIPTCSFAAKKLSPRYRQTA